VFLLTYRWRDKGLTDWMEMQYSVLIITLLLHMRRVDASCAHTPVGSTFRNELTSWPPSWKCDAKSKIDAYLRQEHSRQISSIWNDGALGFFEGGCPKFPNKKNKKKKNSSNDKMSSDVGSVPDPKTMWLIDLSIVLRHTYTLGLGR